MEKLTKFKLDLLNKLKLFIRTSSPVRKLTPVPVQLSLEEAKYLAEVPELKYKPNLTFERVMVDGRVALKITDSSSEPLIKLETHLIPTHSEEADGYTAYYIDLIVARLKAFDSIGYVITDYKSNQKSISGK